MDHRLEALRTWLGGVLGAGELRLQPASVDASFRRYYRIRVGAQSYIAMDAPPHRQDSQAYVRIAQRFLEIGLNVPRVWRQDLKQGFLLVTDLGEDLYLSNLSEATVERLYGDACNALRVLQRGADTDSDFLPDYDEALLLGEMALFQEWYLGRHLGIGLSAGQRKVLARTYAWLSRCALEQPKVWVHRDYHSRNLVVTACDNPGILDFQDAVRGAVTYDLVSLLRDCYIAWPRERVEDWVRGYYMSARRSGIPVGGDEARFLAWFDCMGVQRHLKAIGIFARLHHRDGKPGYLADIPRTLNYVLDVSARYRDLRPLHALLCDLGLSQAASNSGDA